MRKYGVARLYNRDEAMLITVEDDVVYFVYEDQAEDTIPNIDLVMGSLPLAAVRWGLTTKIDGVYPGVNGNIYVVAWGYERPSYALRVEAGLIAIGCARFEIDEVAKALRKVGVGGVA